MKILVDPENLRALSECPDLIEQDFSDPNWQPPDIQSATFDDSTTVPPAEGTQIIVPVDESAPGDTLPIEGDENGQLEMLQELEVEEDQGQEDTGARADNDDNRNSGMRKVKSAKSMSSRSVSSRSSLRSKGSSYMAAIKDYVAAEIVGNSADSMLGLDAPVDTSGFEDQASGALDTAEKSTANLESMATSTADMAGNVEDTMDKIEETYDDKTADSSNAGVIGASTVAGGAAGAAAATAVSRDKEDDAETPSFKSNVKSGIGSIFSSFQAAAKERIATTLLGDELGAHLLEKMEANEDEKEADGDGQGKKPSMRRLGSIL
jgi:hypothetical protein